MLSDCASAAMTSTVVLPGRELQQGRLPALRLPQPEPQEDLAVAFHPAAAAGGGRDFIIVISNHQWIITIDNIH